MIHNLTLRFRLMAGTAMTAAALVASPVLAEEAADTSGLGIIIVEAQKRVQSVQNVPIAVTALGGEALQANRVVNVTDLSSLAPGVTVRTSAGGSRLPNFTIRGATSFGVAPGSDKQVSIYLDGVYLSSPRGTIFDLPDVQRIEVLRGPQGTLFGRNATAGAVSISTRDPRGEAGFKATVTYGNRDQLRTAVSLDLPQFGPFSAYVSYVHDEKRGDIRNTAAGQVWDRTSSALPRLAKVQTSPRWLGSKNSEAFFAAVKFESGDFVTTYKFDYASDDGAAEGTALVGFNPNLGPLSMFIDASINSQSFPVPIAANGKRPAAVANQWVVAGQSEVQGHNLTSTWQVSDNISVKNVFAYRKAFTFSASAIDGIGSVTVTPEAAPFFGLPAFLVGQPFAMIPTNPASSSEQYSDELVISYDSDFVTATVGGLWFYSKDWIGATMIENTLAFTPVFGGVLTNTNIGRNFNKATSIAAYAQLEFHLTPQLDIILGGRITHDKKSGDFTFGPNLGNLTAIPFVYSDTKPNYLIGVNYKPTDDIMVYAKFSTAFVSGGSVATINFVPETVRSVEGGIKTELLNRKLRANLAVFHVKYNNVQSAQGSTGFRDFIIAETGSAAIADGIGTFVVTNGGIESYGFEFDFTAAPTTGLTVGGSLGYANVKFVNPNPALVANNGGVLLPTLRPEWTANLYAQYDTEPLFGNAYLSFRADGNWQSDMAFAQNPNRPIYAITPSLAKEPAYWIINSRVALRDLEIGGANVELSLWAKNLTDERVKTFTLNLADIFAAANFVPARAYGLDLTIEF